MNDDFLIRSLAASKDIRKFLDGSFRSCAQLRTCRVGLGIYQPGWRWSIHAGAQTGQPSQNHVGYVVSGRMTVRSAGGEEGVVNPGEAFEVSPGHDAWVEGDQPCIALDFDHVRRHGHE